MFALWGPSFCSEVSENRKNLKMFDFYLPVAVAVVSSKKEGVSFRLRISYSNHLILECSFFGPQEKPIAKYWRPNMEEYGSIPV